MKYNEWEVKKYNDEAVLALCRAGYSQLAAAALCSRGCLTPEDALAFLSAGEEQFHDPFLLRDMDKAVRRIRQALDTGEKIAVYGDYDVDGITSTCLMVKSLRDLGGLCEYYIPARIEEGYGMNKCAVDRLSKQGVGLIVTVDCGITAFEEIAYAQSLGIDTVITDHHKCRGDLPDAAAVINPFQPDDGYPFKALAGVGVAFKLICALAGREAAMEHIDLVALGTVADVMPLTGENRAIVRTGLDMMLNAPRPGVRSLIREAGLRGGSITAADIAFSLSPRINAAGRMEQVHTATELFLTSDEGTADCLARNLSRMNRERQTIENEILSQARTMLSDRSKGGAIVLSSENWHHGVIGIVSSKLAERYRCRVFLISLLDGIGKASCRSFRGQSVIAAIEAAAEYVEEYGGHEMAAGFTIKQENIRAFAEIVEKYALEHRSEDEAGCRLTIDGVIGDTEQLSLENISGLDVLQPFGHGNPPPVFCIENVEVSNLFRVGAQKDHIKMTVSKNGVSCGGIFFGETPVSAQVCRGDTVDIAFVPKINEFRGVRTPQMQIMDIRPCSAERETMEKENKLFQALENGELTASQARELLPQREDFSAVWRCVCAQSEEEYITGLWKLAAQTGRTSPGKTLVCLRVFSEVGLVELQELGRLLKIKILPVEGKVDLDGSGLLTRLSQAAASRGVRRKGI